MIIRRHSMLTFPFESRSGDVVVVLPNNHWITRHALPLILERVVRAAHMQHFTRLLIWKLFISLGWIRIEYTSADAINCRLNYLLTHSPIHAGFIRRKTLSVVFNNLIDLFSLSFSSTFHISLPEFMRMKNYFLLLFRYVSVAYQSTLSVSICCCSEILSCRC